eukprot:TRINITY_DN1096_c1_g2_i1.p1 TRINITY_DN1096_c1_g2~~TRINITY_DN1096_c1_g2_i1.p1  ORF type:complete len:1013 (+),score=244.87 TRINITY_DN1096_c1_g2_i1:124-3039(+)
MARARANGDLQLGGLTSGGSPERRSRRIGRLSGTAAAPAQPPSRTRSAGLPNAAPGGTAAQQRSDSVGLRSTRIAERERTASGRFPPPRAADSPSPASGNGPALRPSVHPRSRSLPTTGSRRVSFDPPSRAADLRTSQTGTGTRRGGQTSPGELQRSGQWRQAKADSGRIYYWNTHTREVSWNPPPDWKAEPSPAAPTAERQQPAPGASVAGLSPAGVPNGHARPLTPPTAGGGRRAESDGYTPDLASSSGSPVCPPQHPLPAAARAGAPGAAASPLQGTLSGPGWRAPVIAPSQGGRRGQPGQRPGSAQEPARGRHGGGWQPAAAATRPGAEGERRPRPDSPLSAGSGGRGTPRSGRPAHLLRPTPAGPRVPVLSGGAFGAGAAGGRPDSARPNRGHHRSHTHSHMPPPGARLDSQRRGRNTPNAQEDAMQRYMSPSQRPGSRPRDSSRSSHTPLGQPYPTRGQSAGRRPLEPTRTPFARSASLPVAIARRRTPSAPHTVALLRSQRDDPRTRRPQKMMPSKKNLRTADRRKVQQEKAAAAAAAAEGRRQTCPDIDDPRYQRDGYLATMPGVLLNNGRYELLHRLGDGQSATVWLARDRDPREGRDFVAIKITKCSDNVVSSSQHEVQLLFYVRDHTPVRPNGQTGTACLLDHFNHEGPYGIHVCMVFEVLGPTLDILMARTNFHGLGNQTLVKDICISILRGLSELRYMHVVHTDLKPENIMFCTPSAEARRVMRLSVDPGANTDDIIENWEDAGHVKISDFGLSYLLRPPNDIWDNGEPVTEQELELIITSNYQKGAVIQTREYRAPEIILGHDFCCETDIWSLACIAFELVTGEFLFDPKVQSHVPKDDEDAMDEEHISEIIQTLGSPPLKVSTGDGKFVRRFFDPVTGDFLHPQQAVRSDILRQLLDALPDDPEEAGRLFDFINCALTWDPADRPTAADCLQHEWLAPRVRELEQEQQQQAQQQED